MSAAVEAVADAPIAPAAGRVLPVVLVAKRMPTRSGLSSSGPVMNSAAAVAIFSGSRASCRCARLRTSRPQRLSTASRSSAVVTPRRWSAGAGARSGGGILSRQCRAHLRRPQELLRARLARQRHASTTRSLPGTPAPEDAPSARRRSAPPAGGQDGRGRLDRGLPRPRRRGGRLGRRHPVAQFA